MESLACFMRGFLFIVAFLMLKIFNKNVVFI